MIVVKFGGTSVGAFPQIEQAARIVHSMRDSKPIVVVSAMGGVTDALLQAGEAAVTGQTRQRDDKLWEIRSRHDQAINELFKDRNDAVAVQDTERNIWEEIQKVFTGVSLLREMSARSRDLISSFGERLIVPIFAGYLGTLGVEAEPVDAREIIITNEESEFLLVDFDETKKRCQKLTKMAKCYRVHLLDAGRRYDDSRARRLRLFRLDYRQLHQGRRDSNLDRRQRRYDSGPADRSGSASARSRVVQGSRGNVVFRRKGASPPNDHARGGREHSHSHQEHVRSRRARNAHHG